MNKLSISANDASIKYLSDKDKRLAKVIDTIGDIECNIHDDPFEFIVGEIVGQMLSNKVADVITNRLNDLCGGEITLDSVQELSVDDLRGIGISIFVHYTESTGGPIAWDVYLYCEELGKWKSVPIVDENTRFTDVADACGFKAFDEGGPTPKGVEIIDDGIAMLFDHGYKDGPNQTFDFDVAELSFDNGSLSVTDHSKGLVNKYWPLIAD
ncbi:MAG: hypothetical protein K6E34_02505 [Lachnospiraceae bacterium]|nr:hypothetical protein [Lachnospiraceae bacterium]